MKISLFPWCSGVTVLMLLALPAVHAQFVFTTNNGAITITGYDGPGGVVVIPDSTNGYSVTGIGDYAFEDCTNLTSITIPNSVAGIGDGPFLGCSSLTNISVAAGSPSYSSLNGVLFDFWQGTLISFPAGLKNGTYTIPYSATNIAEYAFANCSSLTNMFVAASNVGEAAFIGCTGLISVTVTNQIEGPESHSPISVGEAAFIGCSSLNQVFIAGTVTSIGGFAFAFCTNLTTAYFESNAPPNDGTAFYSDPDAVVYYLSGTTGWGGTFGGVPAVEETAEFEFEYTTNDDSLAITGYLGPLGPVAIPSTIDGYTVTSIGSQAFQGNRRVTSLTISNNVTSIGDYAFAYCPNLTSAYILSNAPPDDGTAFYGDSNAVVYYEVGTIGWGPTFGGAPTEVVTPASDFEYEMYNGSITILYYNGSDGTVGIPPFINGYPVTDLGDAPQQWGNVTNIVIPGSVASIGVNTFAQCYSLASVTIENGVTNIDGSAFYECTGLTSITIPKSLTSIGEDAFVRCTSLTGIAIPDTVTSIGEDAFGGCGLTSIIIPSSVTSIGAAPLGGCYSLTNISVDADNRFYSSLNGVLFDKSCKTLVQYPPGLKSGSYTIPNSVTSIAYQAFGECTNLTSIVIPGSVTNVAAFAFIFCASLKSAYFEGNASPDLGNAFSGDPATVYYLPGTTGWGATFGGVPTALWNPQATTFTTAGGQIGFNITGPTNATIVVEACTNLVNPVWLPVSTTTLSGSGTSSFSDPQSANYPNCYYRFSAP